MNNTIGEEIDFKHNGIEDWSALSQAKKRCVENGYSYGSMARGGRVGIKKGNWHIAKWYNLAKKDVETLDGYIYCHREGYREGDVKIVFFDTPAK